MLQPAVALSPGRMSGWLWDLQVAGNRGPCLGHRGSGSGNPGQQRARKALLTAQRRRRRPE